MKAFLKSLVWCLSVQEMKQSIFFYHYKNEKGYSDKDFKIQI